MIKINLYDLEKAEKKHDSEIEELTPYKSKYHGGRVVIETEDTKYVGSDGNSVLGWTEHENRLVRKHKSVIGWMAYMMQKDPKELDEETEIHEVGHLENPYASEGANRAAVTDYMWKSGKQPSEMHTKFYFN